MIVPVAAVVAVLLLPPLAVLLALRSGSPILRRQVARFNRAVLNPRQLRVAGRPGATMSVLEHRGRRSGRSCTTPVGASRTAHGFVIPLPYGPQSDWARNVLAAGRAVLVVDGSSHEVRHPRVVPIEDALADFTPGERRLRRLTRVRHAMQLRADRPPPASPDDD